MATLYSMHRHLDQDAKRQLRRHQEGRHVWGKLSTHVERLKLVAKEEAYVEVKVNLHRAALQGVQGAAEELARMRAAEAPSFTGVPGRRAKTEMKRMRRAWPRTSYPWGEPDAA